MNPATILELVFENDGDEEDIASNVGYQWKVLRAVSIIRTRRHLLQR